MITMKAPTNWEYEVRGFPAYTLFHRTPQNTSVEYVDVMVMSVERYQHIMDCLRSARNYMPIICDPTPEGEIVDLTKPMNSNKDT